METLKIFIFNWRCWLHPSAGGAEVVTREVARRLASQGHEVHLVCANYWGGKRHDRIYDVEITRLGGAITLYPMAAIYYQGKLRGRFDVVVDEINTVPFFTPLYVKEPKVVLIHQLAAEILFEELSWARAKFWSIMEPWALRLYKNQPLLTVSQSTKKDLTNLGIPGRNIRVIHEGLDHNLYRPGRGKSSYPHVIYIGRIKQFKGIHFIVEAMKHVVKILPNAKLSIAGRGDIKYEAKLRELAKNLKLEKNVEFHGYLTEERKIRLLQEAHILAMASTREGFGLSVIEANACGTPSVVTDVPGLRDSVIKDETGIIVPYGNTLALGNAIVDLLSNNELRERLSQNAITWAKQFDWDKTTSEVLGNIKEVMVAK